MSTDAQIERAQFGFDLPDPPLLVGSETLLLADVRVQDFWAWAYSTRASINPLEGSEVAAPNREMVGATWT
jgi:hypothetical protein